MMFRLLAALTAALLVPATAHAQEQKWYLTGGGDDKNTLVFSELSSVTRKGDMANLTVVLLKLEDENDMNAVEGAMLIDCKQHQFRITRAQLYDFDGVPKGDPIVMGETMPWAKIEPETLFKETEEFACGTTKPNPELLVGAVAPIKAGFDLLRERKEKATKP